MDNADKAIANWITTKFSSPSYARSSHCTKDCGPDEDTIRSVEFGTGGDGYCETCYYEFPAILFQAQCKCGKDKKPTVMNWQIRLDYGFGLADILNEVLALEAQDS